MALTQIQRDGIATAAKDRVSVLDYIPVAEHAAIRAGTSTYDAGANIQSAITNGKTVFFPAGLYRSSQTLNLDVGTKIIGEAVEKSEAGVNKGTGSVIMFTATNNTDGFAATQKNKIEFYDIVVKTTTTFNGQYAIKFVATYSSRFHNVVVANNGVNGSATALFITDDDGDPSTADYAWSNFFDNCLFTVPKNTSNKGHTFEFHGSDSWFNNIYSSGGLGIKTSSGGNNWSNIHCEHAFSASDSKASNGQGAGFTVCEVGYASGDEGLINVTNLYCDLNDIGIKWESTGVGSAITQYNFTNVLTRNNANCDFLFKNSGTSTPNASGGSILNYQSKGTPGSPIKTSGTVTKPYIESDGSSLTNKKVGIETGSPNVLLDVGGSSSGGLNGLTNSTFYTGFENNTNFGGVVMGAGPNGNAPFVAASKKSNGTALDLAFYTNGTKRLSILSSQAGVCFGSDNAAENCLDDYEQGVWTPTISGRTISTATGQYTKIGRVVIARFAISDIDSSITSPSISNLPFQSMGVAQIGICQVGDIRGINYSSGYSNIYGRVNANSTSIEFLQQKTDGSGHATGLSFATNVILRGFVTYFAAV